MIVGTGIDVIEVDRMRTMLQKHGARFVDRVFTTDEQALAPTAADPTPFYAGRWAAKEAVAKALGTGIGEKCAWKDIRVLRGPAGEPQLSLHGDAAQTAAARGIAQVHISISHDRGLACALAVAEG